MMKLNTLSNLFQTLIILTACLGLAFLLFVSPELSSFFNIQKYNTWLQLFFWITAIPVYYILFSLWRLSTDFKQERLFTAETKKRLKIIAYAGIGESIFYAFSLTCGIIFFKINLPFLILSGLFFFIGIIIAIIAALLFYLFDAAEQLQQDNDLTI
ncbi:DUF2975 domain-containing protein [Vagococcus vulneris]|nr:DUF2975 domain-containing protein [Vagococcus vulneris]